MFMLQRMHALRQIASEEGPRIRSITSVSNSTQNQTVSAPAGQKAGDFLILGLVSTSSMTFSSPSGWTLTRSYILASFKFHVFTKTASADNESVDVNSSAANVKSIVYAACANVTGFDAGTITDSSGTAGIDIAAVTATAPGTRIIVSGIDATNATISSGPDGAALIGSMESPNPGLALWQKQGEPAGASPTANVTWSGSTAEKAGAQLHLY